MVSRAPRPQVMLRRFRVGNTAAEAIPARARVRARLIGRARARQEMRQLGGGHHSDPQPAELANSISSIVVSVDGAVLVRVELR